MNCDPNDLVQQARCFKCIPPGMQKEVMTYLLCQIADAATPNYGFLSAFGAGPFVTLVGINTYATVKNYVASANSGIVTANPVTGLLTMSRAATHRVSFSISAQPGNNDQLEADIALNGVPTDIIAAHGSTANPAKLFCMSGTGIISFNAGDTLSLVIQNTGSTTITISHAQISCGAP